MSYYSEIVDSVIEALQVQPRSSKELESLLGVKREIIRDAIQQSREDGSHIIYDQVSSTYRLPDSAFDDHRHLTRELRRISTSVRRNRRGVVEPGMRQFGRTKPLIIVREQLRRSEWDLKLAASEMGD